MLNSVQLLKNIHHWRGNTRISTGNFKRKSAPRCFVTSYYGFWKDFVLEVSTLESFLFHHIFLSVYSAVYGWNFTFRIFCAWISFRKVHAIITWMSTWKTVKFVILIHLPFLTAATEIKLHYGTSSDICSHVKSKHSFKISTELAHTGQY